MKNFQSVGFVHIPRTGGSYVSKKLGIAFYEHSNFPWIQFGWWHRPPHEHLINVKDVWFTIVRNPYDRIASEMKLHRINVKDLLEMKIPEYGHFCMQSSLARYASHICRYENLPDDINSFLAENGYPAIYMGDFMRKTHFLSLSEKDAIRKKYFLDFSEFGYPV